MKSNGYYIGGSTGGWAIYALDRHEDGDGAEARLAAGLDAKAACHKINELIASDPHQSVAQVVVGLPALWCLCASVTDTGIPKGSAAQVENALNYRLEAALPITAEDCVIGYVGHGTERLGIAVETAKLQQLVHSLEEDGHTVHAITPRALLTAQSWCDSDQLDTNKTPTTLIWCETDAEAKGTGQLLHLDPECQPRWRVCSASPRSETLMTQFALDGILGAIGERRWFVDENSETVINSLEQEGIGYEVIRAPLLAELRSARSIIEHADQPWVNLCRGPLAPRYRWQRVRLPAYAAIAAAMMLLATIAAVLLIRADQHQQVAEQFDDQSAGLFEQAMPGQPVPVSPQRRLTTRLRQLRGESGIAAGEELNEAAVPTLNILHDLLVTLPSEQRYAVTDLRLEDGGLRMNGYARSHGEADQLANTLRQAGVFVVEPPSTDALPEGGVRFSLQASHNPPASEEKPIEEQQKQSGPPSLANQSDSGVNR